MDIFLVADWLRRYVDAWSTYDPDKIGVLFSEDVSYRYHPHDDPIIGREDVVRSWLEDRDEPGSFEAHYEPVAVDGEVAVAVGHSSYRREDGSTETYDNCFVMRFDGDGRCKAFTEWFMKRPPD